MFVLISERAKKHFFKKLTQFSKLRDSFRNAFGRSQNGQIKKYATVGNSEKRDSVLDVIDDQEKTDDLESLRSALADSNSR